MAYVLGDGSTLERSTDGVTYNAIVNVTNIVPPRPDPLYISKRNLGSAGAEIQGWQGYSAVDGSAEVSLDTDDTYHGAMLTDTYDGTSPASRYWRVTTTSGAIVTWQGICLFTPSMSVGDWIKGTLTFKVLDPSTISVTP